MDNRSLIKAICKIRSGEEAAFAEIYREFEKLIIHYGRKIGEDGQAELNLFLLELIHSVNTDKFAADESEALQRYLAVALRNKYILLSKKAQAGLRISNELCEETAKYISELDTRISLRDAFLTISERQRQVLTYRYFYGFTDAEIAALLGITRQAVHQLELRAMTELRKFYGAV